MKSVRKEKIGRPIRKRKKKSLKDIWRFEKGPKEDEYNADDEENEKEIEAENNEERNPIIVSDVDEEVLEGEGRSEAAGTRQPGPTKSSCPK